MTKTLQTVARKLLSRAGISIIELLVALTVSLVLAGGIYQLFSGSTRSYRMNQSLGRLQENGRFALHLLRTEVRGAGYLGCLQDVTAFTSTLNNPNDFLFDFTQGIYGLEATGANTWADNTGIVNPSAAGFDNLGLTNPLSGSDILVVRGVAPNVSFLLETPMPSTSADLKLVNGTTGLGSGDLLMITNCSHASVFQVTHYTIANGNLVHNTGAGSPGNSTKNLGHAYAAGDELFIPTTTVFYVRNNVNDQPSLFRKRGTANAEELVEGVETMQVRYGLDTSGDRAVNAYVEADAVTDWQNVVSVRVGLLLRTADEFLNQNEIDNGVYDVSGDGNADFGPADDRRLRLLKSATIGLRNRLR